MKLVLLFLDFLICYSALLDNVRKDVINKALLNLPERESINLLKMTNEMYKAKEAYLMTNLESAYFIYKWIGLNIEYDCFGYNHGNSSAVPVKVYNEGKGGPFGISELFNILCDLLNIESNTIIGLTKINTYNFTKLIEFKEYAWNYILIDEDYYLIDASMGSGYCIRNSFSKKYSDFYFGMNPEIFIRFHYPNDNKWQLLPKIIEKDEFKSMAFLYEGFYSLGFKSISPDIQTLNESITVRLTSDKSFDKIYDDVDFSISIDVLYEMPEFGFVFVKKISNGIYEFEEDPYGKGYEIIYVKNKKTEETIPIILFEYNN